VKILEELGAAATLALLLIGAFFALHLA